MFKAEKVEMFPPVDLFPPEIINHIYSYVQSATNEIMKQHFHDIYDFEYTPTGMLHLNSQYGFKQFDYHTFSNAYDYRCDLCNANLWPDEYRRNILCNDARFCSRKCKNEYECMTKYILSS